MAIAELLQEALSQVLPENVFTQFISNHALIIFIVFAVILFGGYILLDFLADVWKIPFALAVDIADMIAIVQPSYDYYAAVGAFFVFFLLVWDCPKIIKYGFAIASVAACLMPMFSVIPVVTILMTAAAILDRGL